LAISPSYITPSRYPVFEGPSTFDAVGWSQVPEVYWETTCTKVLTMEYVKGARVNDTTAIAAMGLNHMDVANALAVRFTRFRDKPDLLLSGGSTGPPGAWTAACVLSLWEPCGLSSVSNHSDAKVANRNVRDFGWEIAHAAVSRRPPVFLPRIVALPRATRTPREFGLCPSFRTILCHPNAAKPARVRVRVRVRTGSNELISGPHQGCWEALFGTPGLCQCQFRIAIMGLF
jgi:hypothetical protein